LQKKDVKEEEVEPTVAYFVRKVKVANSRGEGKQAGGKF